jgi:methyl-accepting chemotaxis protein
VRRRAERSEAAGREIGGLASSSGGSAERSGKLLSDLVPTIRKTADLVREVTAASTEQSAGVSQINRAMTAVDQATQRNASASEELASTAEEMAAQAGALQETIAFFKLDGVRDAPAASSRTGLAPATGPFGNPAGSRPAPASKGGNGFGGTKVKTLVSAENYTSF